MGLRSDVACRDSIAAGRHYAALRTANFLHHLDEGDFLVGFVAGDTEGPGVEHRLAVHQKLIVVVAVAEGDLEEPSAVCVPLHGEGLGVPVVEIPDQGDLAGGWGGANETDHLGQFLGGVMVLVVMIVMVGVGIGI